jgi:hypothetical protein
VHLLCIAVTDSLLFVASKALEQHTEGKKLKGPESEFESYLRDLQRQVIYQQAFG